MVNQHTRPAWSVWHFCLSLRESMRDERFTIQIAITITIAISFDFLFRFSIIFFISALLILSWICFFFLCFHLNCVFCFGTFGIQITKYELVSFYIYFLVETEGHIWNTKVQDNTNMFDYKKYQYVYRTKYIYYIERLFDVSNNSEIYICIYLYKKYTHADTHIDSKAREIRILDE